MSAQHDFDLIETLLGEPLDLPEAKESVAVIAGSADELLAQQMEISAATYITVKNAAGILRGLSVTDSLVANAINDVDTAEAVKRAVGRVFDCARHLNDQAITEGLFDPGERLAAILQAIGPYMVRIWHQVLISVPE